MKLPHLAIKNHQFTLIILLSLVLSGIISFLSMPRTEDPPVSKSGSSVIVIYPGANPADLEQLVVDPVEEAVNELEDILELQSSIEDGIAVINIEFELNTDPDEKYSDVIQKVNSIRDDLPEEILELKINKWNVSDVNILQIALVSDTSPYKELETQAEELKTRVERVNGIKNSKIYAYPEQEIRVSINPEKMAQMNISVNQVLGSIKSANLNIPGGHIDIGSRRFNIKTSGNFSSIQDIQNTIVHTNGSQIVYLKDIAHVTFSHEDINYHARFNGSRCVFIGISQKTNTNIFSVMKSLKQEINRFNEALPPSISLYYVFDQSESVSSRLNGFFLNLIEGVFLVGIVIFLALSIRASLTVMIAIPVSILIGIGFVDMSGYGLQQMTIAGLVVVLGILVDNAIVVTENISRFLTKGYGQEEAAIAGTSQIGWAIVSSTATTILAFIPMMMIKDITGDFIRSMPVTVVYTLSASLLVALILTPYVARLILSPEQEKKKSGFQRFFDAHILKYYKKILAFALDRTRITVAIAVIIFLISLMIFPFVGVSFFPKAEKPQFFINIDTPDGSSLDRTDAAARFVEAELSKYSGIEKIAANIGRGNPRVYYNVIEKEKRVTHSQIFIHLESYNYDKMTRLITELREKFSSYPDARIEIKELEQGPPVEAPIAIKVVGKDLNELKRLSQYVESIIRDTRGTVNVNNPLGTPKTDLHVSINRDKAGMLGIPLSEIDQTVRAAMTGIPISTFHDEKGKEYDIVVRLPFSKKTDITDFQRIYVTSASGMQIPLNQIATLEFKASPQEINHLDLERNVTITADVMGNYSVDKVTRHIIDQLNKYEWPQNYEFYVGGELESQQESFSGMFKAIIVALLGILAVLVLQFKSFSQPLIVFSAIPLAFIGSILALLITGYTFSFTAFVGLTSLVGIVVNNSIILVDYTNQLRADGYTIRHALMEAGETRFRPIILTTLTTIGGLLPLTLQGGTLWAPMGWTIIGGLFTSTFLTLIFVPVLYILYNRE